MATINPRYDKSGNIISYQIRVFRGRDSSGKRLKDYMMTWRPDPSMTKRQIEREVQRQATLFEENCKIGNVSTEKMTFERYAAYVIDLKERTGLKAKTVERYRDMLPRINAEIGPLKLQDIRADHLNVDVAYRDKVADLAASHSRAPFIRNLLSLLFCNCRRT